MPDNPNVLPAATIANLSPPSDTYSYFAHGQDHPFDPLATDFSLVNAGWLADAALLVYGTRDFITDRLTVSSATNEMSGDYFSGDHSQCLVLSNDRFALVAFRGTRIDQFPDAVSLLASGVSDLGETIPPGRVVLVNWLDATTDLDFALDPASGVHRGFAGALAEIWDEQVKPHLDALKAGNPRLAVWFTGHSMGAALATLAAHAYSQEQEVQALYTFGSPRVGNSHFVDQFSVPGFRWVHRDDIVARLPPADLFADYSHLRVGLKYLTGEGSILDNPNLTDQVSDSFTGALEQLRQSLAALSPGQLLQRLQALGRDRPHVDLLHFDPSELVTEILKVEVLNNLRTLNVEIPAHALSDHAPLYYALRIRQNIARL